VRAITARLVRSLVAGAVIGIAGIALVYGAWRSCGPYVEEWRTHHEVAALERRVSELRVEQRRLQQQAEALVNADGIKAEARRLGMVKPGERLLRFMTRPKPREALPQAEPAPSGAIHRLRSWGRRLLAPPEQAQAPEARARPKPDN